MGNNSDGLNHTISKLNDKIQFLETSNAQLKAMAEDTSSSDSLAKSLIKAKEKKNKLKSELSSTSRNLQDIESKLKQNLEEVESKLKNVEEEKSTQLMQLNKELKESKAQIEKKIEELRELSSDQQKLKDDLENAEVRKDNAET